MGNIYIRAPLLGSKLQPGRELHIGDGIKLKAYKESLHFIDAQSEDTTVIHVAGAQDLASVSLDDAIVFIYPGTYSVGTTLNVGQRTRVIGIGIVTLQWTGAAGGVLISVGSDSRVENITFAAGDYIALSMADGVVVDHVVFENVTTAIYLPTTVSNVIVSHCKFDGCTNAYKAEAGASPSEWTIERNRYINVTTVYNWTGATNVAYINDDV